MTSKNNPFPGMDPYFEERWPEVHASLIVYARNQINPQLPDDLRTNIEETLAVCVDDDYGHSIRPDLQITGEDAEFLRHAAPGIAVAEPVLVARTPRPQRHLEIVNAAGRVVTVIEFLSPANKVRATGRERYVAKQRDYLDAGLNLVEIDLTRQGHHIVAAPETELPNVVRPDYMFCVFRAMRPDRFEFYPVSLRTRLPNIRIPLRPFEADVVLQLQPLIDDCYRDGLFHRTDYQRDPAPPLPAADAQWLDNLLRERGLRR